MPKKMFWKPPPRKPTCNFVKTWFYRRTEGFKTFLMWYKEVWKKNTAENLMKTWWILVWGWFFKRIKEQWPSGQGAGFPIQASRVQNHWVAPRSSQPFILPRSIKWVPEISGNLVVKSKLPPRSGSSLEAVEPGP